jgi:hypothetical protein
MDAIKCFDFFGGKFHFYTNNQPSYRNIFGGIMYLIYIILCILIFIIGSYDDLHGLNPSTTTSDITEKEPRKIDLNEEKIWIPFRLVNYENKFIRHRGILHIVPYFIEGHYYNNKMNLTYHELNYTLCNETAMANRPENYKINIPLDQLYCIEQDGVLFGGFWNSEFMYYIEINLYLCDGNIIFNSSDPRCKKTDELLKQENSALIFDFYYPVVQFQPRNLETPIAIIYKNFYYRLSAFSHKLEKIFIREYILSDDKNLLTTNYKNSSIWGTSLLYSDDYYLTEGFDPIANSDSKVAYSLNIYMDNGFIYYTRSNKKIFLIISNLFPIFRLLLYFMKKITQHIKMSIIKRKMVGAFFEYKEIKSERNIKKNNIIDLRAKFDDIRNNKKEEIIDPNNNCSRNYILNVNRKLIKNNFINNNINKDYYSKNKEEKRVNISKDENIKTILNKGDFLSSSINHNESLSFYENFQNEKTENKNKKHKGKYIFPYYYFFMDFIFDKISHPEKFFCIPKKYFIVYNYMCQIYDISSHITLFKQINAIKKSLENKKFESSSEINSKVKTEKININHTESMKNLSRDLKRRISVIFSNDLI